MARVKSRRFQRLDLYAASSADAASRRLPWSLSSTPFWRRRVAAASLPIDAAWIAASLGHYTPACPERLAYQPAEGILAKTKQSYVITLWSRGHSIECPRR